MYINSLVLMDNIFRWIMNEIKLVNSGYSNNIIHKWDLWKHYILAQFEYM